MRKFLFFTIAAMLLCACGENNSRRQSRGETKETASVSQVETTEQVSSTPLLTPTINVYIENSGSMDGYVKGVTEFKNSVYNYLSDIMISGVSDSMNLFYINSRVIKFDLTLEDFIQKLDPTIFRRYGGNRGTSDIANVIGDVLNKTKKNEIAILVTDGIFSPGRGVNADEYLINQQIGIKRRMSDYLKKYPNTAVIVYQLSSNFNGTYYNKVDDRISLNEQRPFYLWVIGDAKQVSNLRNKVSDDRFKGSGVQNVFTAIAGNRQIKYALNPSIGTYEKSRIDTRSIRNLKKDSRTGKVQFAVNADFSDLLLDDSYLLNAANYDNNSKYTLTVKPYTVQNSAYSHTLTFTATDRVYSGNISVKLKAVLPTWIEAANDDEGKTAIKGKTYGIKYQLGGVFDAFTFNNNYYTEIQININK